MTLSNKSKAICNDTQIISEYIEKLKKRRGKKKWNLHKHLYINNIFSIHDQQTINILYRNLRFSILFLIYRRTDISNHRVALISTRGLSLPESGGSFIDGKNW